MNLQTCRWCGMIHGERCPAVKAIEFHPDGSVKRVEFWADDQGVTVTTTRKAVEDHLAEHARLSEEGLKE